MRIEGRAWILGDGIDTDLLAPGYAMKLPPEELAQHCLEAVEPRFAKEVQPGDIIVAGKNFGLGSSREQAAISLKTLKVGAILAQSFARIFYRNAMNIGLPALTFPHKDEIKSGDPLIVEPDQGQITLADQNRSFEVSPIPDHLLAMVKAGGMIPHLKARLQKERLHELA